MSNFESVNFKSEVELEKLGLYWEKWPDQDWNYSRLVIFGRQYKAGDLVLIDSTKSYIGFPINKINTLPNNVCLLISKSSKIPHVTNHPILRAERLNHIVDDVMRDKRNKYKGRVISVTGSVGKTSTTAILSKSLRLFGPVLVSIRENLRSGIYQKLNIIKNEPFSIFEVSAGGLRTVTDVLQSDIAVLLNVGEAHLEHYSTLENLVKHKAKVFEGCPSNGVGVLCTELPYFDIVLDIAKKNGRKTITYGKSKLADIRLLSFSQGILFFEYKNKVYSVQLNTKDEHQALNLLASLAVLIGLDLPWEKKLVQLGLCITVIEGRGDEHDIVFDSKQIKIIDSAFNSSPLALVSTLKSFNVRDDFEGRKIVVLSDMLELGNKSELFHQNLIDTLDIYQHISCYILIGKMMSSITPQVALSKKIHQFSRLEDAFEFLKGYVRSSDTILFKGSNGTGLRKKLWETFK